MTKLAYFQRQFAELKDAYLSAANDADAEVELLAFEKWLKKQEYEEKYAKFFEYLDNLPQMTNTPIITDTVVELYCISNLVSQFKISYKKAHKLYLLWKECRHYEDIH